jgi:anti-sigma factor RsiW
MSAETGASAERVGCARVRARLARLVDGGLAPLEAALDCGHLEACAGCRRERAEHERLLAAIRALSAARAEDLEPAWAALREELGVPLGAARRRWLVPTVSAAAAVLLVVLLAASDASVPPGSVDLATLDRFLEQLPRWEDVVRGLEALARHA